MVLNSLQFRAHVLFGVTCQTSIKTVDQIDLLREQQKILSGEVALHSSALKRLSGEAARNPKKEHIHVITRIFFVFNTDLDMPHKLNFCSFLFKAEIRKLNDEIRRKNEQIALLEKRIDDSVLSSHDKMDNVEASQVSLHR